jgi:radical SAM superfamily enzyme YgiQ (UPF0313 family)
VARSWQKVWFFQPRTEAGANYKNGDAREQTWLPWFALFLAPAAAAAGLPTGLIDARIDPHWEREVARLGPGDILAVSVMTGAAIRDAVTASTIARQAGVFVVWGGPHPTLFPHDTLAQSPAHAVVPGYGYAGFARLLSRLTGQPENLGDTAIVLTEDHVFDEPSAAMLTRPGPARRGTPVVDSAAPPPDLNLITDWEPYLNPDVAIAPRTTNFVTSEGCVRRCTFCSEPQTSGGAWFVRSIDTSVASLAELVARSNATGVKLHDPNFFADLDRAGYFGERVRETLGLPWAASLHPADLTAMPDEVLARSADHGLCRVLVGLETPVPELINLAGKHYDPAQIPSMARRLAAVGVRGMFTFIVGWPDADPSHYQDTIDAAFSIRDQWTEHQCKIHFLEPWPGTPLFRLLQRRGFPYPTSLEGWANVDYYEPQHRLIHDESQKDRVRAANSQLSPYVDA